MNRVFLVWLLWLVERYEEEIGDGSGSKFFEWCLKKVSEDGNK